MERIKVVIQHGRVSTAVFQSAIVHLGHRQREFRIWTGFISFFPKPYHRWKWITKILVLILKLIVIPRCVLITSPQNIFPEEVQIHMLPDVY